MPNIKSMINKQNTSRLNNSDNKVDAKQCNCRSDKKLGTHLQTFYRNTDT